jgi:hypothetical protein
MCSRNTGSARRKRGSPCRDSEASILSRWERARTSYRCCLTLGLAQLRIELDGQSVGANGEGAVVTSKEAADGITAFNRSMRRQRTARCFVARHEAPVGTCEGLQGCGIHVVHGERRAQDLQLALGVERGLRVGTHRDDTLDFLDCDLFLPDEIAPLHGTPLLSNNSKSTPYG